jgi:hypothetical protein
VAQALGLHHQTVPRCIELSASGLRIAEIVVLQLFISDSRSAPMPTECNADLFGFAPVEGRRVEAWSTL